MPPLESGSHVMIARFTDQLIRQTIMSTQDDVKEIKDDLKAIKEKLYE